MTKPIAARKRVRTRPADSHLINAWSASLQRLDPPGGGVRRRHEDGVTVRRWRQGNRPSQKATNRKRRSGVRQAATASRAGGRQGSCQSRGREVGQLPGGETDPPLIINPPLPPMPLPRRRSGRARPWAPGRGTPSRRRCRWGRGWTPPRRPRCLCLRPVLTVSHTHTDTT